MNSHWIQAILNVIAFLPVVLGQPSCGVFPTCEETAIKVPATCNPSAEYQWLKDLFYNTDGVSWINNDKWMHPNVSHCDW